VGFVVVTQLKADAPADDAEASEQADEKGEGGEEERKAKGDGEEGEDDEPAPVPVEVAEAGRGSVAAWIAATANIVAENDVRVLAETEGRITRIAVEEGQRVAKGQVLAELDRGEMEIVADKARARAESAERALERTRAMREQELVSREELDRVTTEHEVARQELAEAEYQLGRRTVRAPFAGQVTERMVTVGQRVKPADPLFAVTDFDPLIARIYLPEKDVIGLAEGREVELGLDAAAGVRFAGRIRQISPVVDVATGTVKVTVEAVAPPADVRPGGFVTVRIERERRDGVIVLPREAVLRELKTAHVFVNDDGTAQKVPVELGLEEGDLVEVTAGLAGGEQVITAGQGGLKVGAAVKVVDAKPQA
jgi:membrane fusion protein (multidrug efflux system)